MDTSETYIKMCEKAGKIQSQWKVQAGDWVRPSWSWDSICIGDIIAKPDINDEDDILFGVVKPKYKPVLKQLYIWLPRQDQLQEMLQPCGFSTLLIYFPEYAQKLTRNEQFTSMEQLWLAFVMSERYQKIWDGIEWITVSDKAEFTPNRLEPGMRFFKE